MTTSPTIKRARSDSKLDNLQPEQRDLLIRWMVARHAPAVLVKMVKDQFGVSTSLPALSRFHKKHVGPHLVTLNRLAVQTANYVEAAASAQPDLFDAATIRNLRQRAFEMSCNPEADIGEVKDLFDSLIKERQTRVKEGALQLSVRQFQFDAIAAVKKHADLVREVMGDAGLSEAERTEKLGRAIFGEEWSA